MLNHTRLGFFLVFVTIVAFVVGCTDRGTNLPDNTVSKGGPFDADHDFAQELYLQIGRNPSESPRVAFPVKWYAPASSIPTVTGGQPQPAPLLILLPPQDGDVNFYYNLGLAELANEMIALGTIQPMIIACIENDQLFGGYFYAGDSPAAGYYDELIGRALVDYLYDQGAFGYVDRSLPLGIGGVGMGGYGAFRAAMLNPGLFNSVSVSDGPLDFNGPTGSGGFVELFEDALTEQGLLGQTGWRSQFDSSSAFPLSRLFIGGGLAFSPHDTFIDTTSIVFVDTGSATEPPHWIVNIPDSQRFVIEDSLTLMTGVVKPDPIDFDFHVPFDSTGAPYALIWDMWLKNNLERILSDSGIASLDGVSMWFGTTPENNFANYHQQTLSWIQTLRDNGFDPEVREYIGYGGNPAVDDRYVYDLMREMLIFHSKVFEQAMQP